MKKSRCIFLKQCRYIVAAFLLSGVAVSPVIAESQQPQSFADKNELLSSIMRQALNGYLQANGYGELNEFAINNKTKKLFFKTMLKGEEKPLSVSVGQYEFIEEEGKYFFVAHHIVTDREWLNTAAKNFLEERKIEIPPEYTILILTVMQ